MMRKFIDYDSRRFWMITSASAVRPHNQDSLEILTFNPNGEVQYKERSVSRSLYTVVKSEFQREGIV